ncbi:hypothetical protein [Janthinobacterium sp. PSPC3-1]|uniref:hypothetical protein n=1 Tax=Janthinobacterium sp. PSPC3-1 TaxID=2804653 RepID=UPI003CEC9E2C
MTRIVMLKSAELDFKELCHDFKARHGAPACAAFRDSFKTLLTDLNSLPTAAHPSPKPLPSAC